MSFTRRVVRKVIKRSRLVLTSEGLRDHLLRKARFTALLKDGRVIEGRIGFSTLMWFGYHVDDSDDVHRVQFDDIDTAEIG